MLGDARTRQWLPLLATAALFVAVEYVAYTEVSRTWADLAGLMYLLASPAVYRTLSALAAEASAATPGDAEVTA